MSSQDDEMGDAMEGIFAYDMGCVDSGIHDEVLRERVKEWLHTVDMRWLSAWVRENWLSDKALDQGYRLEDVKSFIDWLSDRMDYDL